MPNKEKGYKKQQRIDFSNRLKEIIEMRGLKIYDIAIKTKIPEQMISEYASGKYVPRPRNLVKLSEALGVNHLWLIGQSDELKNDTAGVLPEGLNLNSFLTLVSHQLTTRVNADLNYFKFYFGILTLLMKLNIDGLKRVVDHLEDLSKVNDYTL